MSRHTGGPSNIGATPLQSVPPQALHYTADADDDDDLLSSSAQESALSLIGATEAAFASDFDLYDTIQDDTSADHTTFSSTDAPFYFISHFTQPSQDLPPLPPPPTPPPLHGDVSCLHPLHPAYADTYLSLLCPACQLNKLVGLARIPALTITARGGRELWKQTFTLNKSGGAYTDERHHFFTTVGQHRRRTPSGRDWHVDWNGSVSFPRGKTSVLNYLQRLEDLAEVETAWEARNPNEGRDEETTKRYEEAWVHTASSALALWHGSMKDGFEKVEKMSAEFSRKRGRELEIASHPDFPGSQDLYTRNRVLNLTQEQRDFINANLPANSNNAGDDAEEPRKRKRCRLSASLDFDTHIYVRSEADIDLLFAPASGLTADFLEDTQSPRPGRSILRTAPRRMHPPPPRPYEVRQLKTRENFTAGRVRRHRDQWREGYDIVDTSGWKKKGKWDGYKMGLAVEAGQETTVEEEDQDTEAIQGETVEGELNGEDAVEAGPVEGQVVAVVAIDHESIEEAGIDEDEVPTDDEVTAAEIQIEQAQQARQAQPAVDETPRFRPHGGIASAFAFGTLVAGAAIKLTHRAGLW